MVLAAGDESDKTRFDFLTDFLSLGEIQILVDFCQAVYIAKEKQAQSKMEGKVEYFPIQNDGPLHESDFEYLRRFLKFYSDPSRELGRDRSVWMEVRDSERKKAQDKLKLMRKLIQFKIHTKHDKESKGLSQEKLERIVCQINSNATEHIDQAGVIVEEFDSKPTAEKLDDPFLTSQGVQMTVPEFKPPVKKQLELVDSYVPREDLGKLDELRNRIKGVSLTSEKALVPNRHIYLEFRRGETQYLKCSCSDYFFPARFLFVSPRAMARVFVSFSVPKPDKEKHDFSSMERDFEIDFVDED